MSRLGRHLAAGLDPVALARQIGLECDPWQAKVLRDPADRELLIVHRQGGKSATAAVAAVSAALYVPGSLTLVVSPSQRQSQELFRTILVLYRSLGRPVPAETENSLSIILENGSRIVALPADATTIRGYSAVRLLIIDEAAFVPDATLAAVRPMLAVSGGRMLAMSTPFGRRGWFYEASRSKAWRITTVTADQCPRISPEFLEAEREAGGWRFKQEYLCEFTDVAGLMFSADDIDAIFTAGNLGAITGGLLFGPQSPPPRIEAPVEVAAPRVPRRLRAPWCPHHVWSREFGRCIHCGADMPVLTAGGAA